MLIGVENGEWGTLMNIEEAVANAAKMSEGSAIVARPPFTWGAEAMFVELTEDYRVPGNIDEAGLKYLIEKEDLMPLIYFLNTKRVSKRAAAEFVIHYAVYDCAPAWIIDIPDI